MLQTLNFQLLKNLLISWFKSLQLLKFRLSKMVQLLLVLMMSKILLNMIQYSQKLSKKYHYNLILSAKEKLSMLFQQHIQQIINMLWLSKLLMIRLKPFKWYSRKILRRLLLPKLILNSQKFSNSNQEQD